MEKKVLVLGSEYSYSEFAELMYIFDASYEVFNNYISVKIRIKDNIIGIGFRAKPNKARCYISDLVYSYIPGIKPLSKDVGAFISDYLKAYNDKNNTTIKCQSITISYISTELQKLFISNDITIKVDNIYSTKELSQKFGIPYSICDTSYTNETTIILVFKLNDKYIVVYCDPIDNTNEYERNKDGWYITEICECNKLEDEIAHIDSYPIFYGKAEELNKVVEQNIEYNFISYHSISLRITSELSNYDPKSESVIDSDKEDNQ